MLLGPRPLKALANGVIKSLLPRVVRIGSAEVCLNPADPVISGALALRVYEKQEIAIFRSLYQPGMTFVDVGANVGLYTALAMASGSAGGRIVCLEPDAESRRFLNQTVERNSKPGGRHVFVLPYAASDSNGSCAFYRNPHNKGDNRLYADPLLQEHSTVETRTLDSLCEDFGIGSLQLLKIDVQGAEGKVIAGAARVLQKSKDCIIMTEFWPYGLFRCGFTPRRYLDMLCDLGFVLFSLARDGLVPAGDKSELIAGHPGRRYANLVALKGSYKKYGTR